MHCKAPNNHKTLNRWEMLHSNLYSPLWGLFGTHRPPKGSIFAGKNLPGWKATERPKALQDPLAKWATLIIAFKTIFRPQLFTRCIMFPANHLIFSWQISQIRLMMIVITQFPFGWNWLQWRDGEALATQQQLRRRWPLSHYSEALCILT